MKLSMTVKEFCAAHSIGPTTFYALQRSGEGPQLMKVGRRTLISCEASAAWRQRMEQRARERSEGGAYES